MVRIEKSCEKYSPVKQRVREREAVMAAFSIAHQTCRAAARQTTLAGTPSAAVLM
jgi:hypothetical protein